MAVNRRRKPVPAKDETAFVPGPPEPIRHIELLTVENIKRIKWAQLKLKGMKAVRISGANAAGKSSLIDSLFYAFKGLATLPADPIRRGADRAKIEIDLGDIVVSRKMVRGGKRGGVLVVFDKAAKSERRFPQEHLIHLIGERALDPLEFIRMDQEEQLEALQKLIPESAEIDRMENASDEDYQNRTVINRQIPALELKLAEMPVVADLPAEPVDESALTQRLADAGEANLERERSLAQKGRLEDALSTVHTLKQDDEGQLVKLRKQVAALEKSIVGHTNSIAAYQKQLEAHTVPEVVSTVEIQREVEFARNMNRAIARRDERTKLERERDDLKKQAQALTQAIEERTQRRDEILANAKLPLEGLAYNNEHGVLYNGLPFDQLSDGEQITVASSIAMSGDASVRVLRIKDASLLDEKSKALILKVGDERNYQVIFELVDASGETGFVIEDGEVKRDAN